MIWTSFKERGRQIQLKLIRLLKALGFREEI